MKANNRNFGKQDKAEFEAVKRDMNRDSNNRQQDIESRKKNMENNYTTASAAYGSSGNTSTLQPPAQKELGQNPAMERYKLPEQVDETARVRKGVIIDDEATAEAPDSAYIEDGDGSPQETKQSKRISKDKIKQLGIISVLLFAVMGGLVYISRRQRRKNQ